MNLTLKPIENKEENLLYCEETGEILMNYLNSGNYIKMVNNEFNNVRVVKFDKFEDVKDLPTGSKRIWINGYTPEWDEEDNIIGWVEWEDKNFELIR